MTTDMDLYLLRVQQQQVCLQCRFVLFAAEELDQAKRNPHRDRVDRTYFAIQNLLVAAANIAKVMWGRGGGKMMEERRKLRESLGVADVSILTELDLRNRFEHFDEQIASWRERTKKRNFSDLNIGPREYTRADLDSRDCFRNYDAETMELSFWDLDVLNLREVIEEVHRILPRAEAETAKPFWEP